MEKKEKKVKKTFPKNLVVIVLMGLAVIIFFNLTKNLQRFEPKITYTQFIEELGGKDPKVPSNVLSVEFTGLDIRGELKTESTFFDERSNREVPFKYFRTRLPFEDKELVDILNEKGVSVSSSEPRMWKGLFFQLVIPVLFLGLLWLFFIRQMQAGGSRALAFGKSQAKLLTEAHPKITFKDVAGEDEAKQELQEIVEFLKDPKRFQKLGAKIPKGVLLYGPPGCGKTLLARAIAGEADVPFFSISGSDFVEMFVGVGASRVRDMFERGRKNAPALIFIDEIDAVGRQRFAGIGGGHDEREQTLNQLLTEMDGFDTKEGVILLAATNRPDVLDAALLRPGRFDRQIEVYSPDLKGREEILQVHTKKVVLDKDVDVKTIAQKTPGFSGADLANVVNEAALLSARHNKAAVEMEDFDEATERVIAGPERKSRVISDYEKSIVAYHESGHALLALLIPEVDPLHKVSIIPRGGQALGYTLQLPMEDRYLTTKKELLGRMTVFLGGRVSEELVYNESTSGAQNDLEMVTQAARKMVCEFGMSKKLGPITFREREERLFLGRDLARDKHYSEKIALDIDSEIRTIVDECYHRAESLLKENRKKLDKLAESLKKREVLDGEAVKKIVGMEKPQKPRSH
ncbi:ATP-dependent zinc metalloprotease FtsH [candidate division NPL-UPA2 bacterium]|nr:ATP-dependent zinc metalloprotease FtsH [candidate division NPL-UPA2 bacterium]